MGCEDEALNLHNPLTGGLAPLRGCTALRALDLEANQLAPSDEDKAHFEEQCGWGEFMRCTNLYCNLLLH